MKGNRKKQALREKKPEKIIDKIVSGRIEKIMKKIVFLNRPLLDQDISIKELLNNKIAQMGENIIIRRFTF